MFILIILSTSLFVIKFVNLVMVCQRKSCMKWFKKYNKEIQNGFQFIMDQLEYFRSLSSVILDEKMHK